MADEAGRKGNPAVWVVGCLTLAIVALLICGLAATCSRLPHFGTIEKAKVGAAAGDIGAFNSALALYQVDVQCKQFPVTLLQLYSDNAAGWSGPYMATITPDPWDNAYTYTSDGSNYTIQSVHDASSDKSETIRYIFAQGMMESIP